MNAKPYTFFVNPGFLGAPVSNGPLDIVLFQLDQLRRPLNLMSTRIDDPNLKDAVFIIKDLSQKIEDIKNRSVSEKTITSDSVMIASKF